MATTKAAATKKTPTKKAPASAASKKKSVTTKKVTKKAVAQSPEVRSFKVAKSSQKFTDFKLSRQTIYWIILIAFIIFAQLWIIKLQVDIGSLLGSQQTQITTN